MSRRTPLVVAGVLIVLIAQVVLATGSRAVDRTQLLGVWTSVDTDGSHQSLTIRGGGSNSYAMFLYDDAASSACGGAPARVTGSGSAAGDVLTMRGTLTCAPGGNVIRSRLSLEFAYDEATGTLTDFSAVVWQRT